MGAMKGHGFVTKKENGFYGRDDNNNGSAGGIKPSGCGWDQRYYAIES